MSGIIELSDAIKQFTLDQDKIMTPEETVRNFKKKTAKLNMQILEYTKRIDNGRLDIPVYFSVCGKDARKITGTNKQMGKGATPVQSEASAVMELAERFSFFSFKKNQANFKDGAFPDFEKIAIPFDLIAASVHEDAKNAEEAKEFFNLLSFEWTEGYNITKKAPVLVPFDWFYAINEFNGPSAGNCKEEAIMQGISEIIERHVCSIISEKKLSVPLIRPESVKDEIVCGMLEKYKKAGIELFISDFSLDTGIPTVGVLAYDPSTFPEKSEIVWTAGTAPDPVKALSRALTEIAQLAGDFNTGSNYLASGLPKLTSLDQTDFIRKSGKSVDIEDLPDISDNNIRIEIENAISCLDKLGMEIILIETTHKDLGIPAFYTIIPGARFRERALNTTLAMFCAKLIIEKFPADMALPIIMQMDKKLQDRYYLKFYAGMCLYTLEEYEEALAFFKKAMELGPNSQDEASIYSYMAQCLKEQEKYHEALEILEKGMESDDERTDILNLMGFCQFKLKRHEKAIESFEKLIKLDPSSAIDYANIGSNYRELGDRDNAIRYYKKALEIDPKITFALENILKLGGDLSDNE
ncbi:YcaO-like family protein [Desulforegula conservatrix]|uniref:YcaO-like family protein n=1 Tax=Desulforegula conservatrix TaxID=153026 RepID=UPI0004252FA7|nr:YcaO-like family protein [Desulforegula conservatrix]